MASARRHLIHSEASQCVIIWSDHWQSFSGDLERRRWQEGEVTTISIMLWHNTQSVCWHWVQHSRGVSPGLSCFWCASVFWCFCTLVNIHVPACVCSSVRVQACLVFYAPSVFFSESHCEVRRHRSHFFPIFWAIDINWNLDKSELNNHSKKILKLCHLYVF